MFGLAQNSCCLLQKSNLRVFCQKGFLICRVCVLIFLLKLCLRWLTMQVSTSAADKLMLQSHRCRDLWAAPNTHDLQQPLNQVKFIFSFARWLATGCATESTQIGCWLWTSPTNWQVTTLQWSAPGGWEINPDWVYVAGSSEQLQSYSPCRTIQISLCLFTLHP